jgi:hypothetical protein
MKINLYHFILLLFDEDYQLRNQSVDSASVVLCSYQYLS